MTFERRTDNGNNGPDESRIGTGPLSPKSVREAIMFMLKGYGEYPDEARIAFYVDTLDACTVKEVWAAIKTWRRQPMDRAAKPGELRSMVLTARDTSGTRASEAELEKGRVTPEEKREVLKSLTPEALAFLRPILRETAPDLLKALEAE